MTVRVQGMKKLTAPVIYELVDGKWQIYEVSSAKSPDKAGNAYAYDGYGVEYAGDDSYTYSFVVAVTDSARSFKVVAEDDFTEWPEVEIIPDASGDKLQVYLDPEELYDLICDEFYRTTHVYIPFNYGGNGKEENRAKAEDIYARLESGELSFERDQFEGGVDQALPDAGFYFSRGYAELDYEAASCALAVGETSELVELGSAFYIIKRLELDTEYVMGNMFTLRTQYMQSQFNSLLNDYKNKLEVNYLKEIDLTSVN
jgi:hypothetical protein